MCQKMRLFIIVSCTFLFLGCRAEVQQEEPNQPNPNIQNPDVTFDDFLESMKIAFSNNNNDDSNSDDIAGAFPEDLNSQVTVKGTSKTLLVDQAHLDTELTSLPEYISIILVTRGADQSNGDVTFEGEVLLTQKSLITDIKQAIASDPKEIEQSTIDAKEFTFLLEDVSFTITFHRFNNDYIQLDQEDEDEYDINRVVQVENTNYTLLALKDDLDADIQTLPDQVMIYLVDLGQPSSSDEIPTELSISSKLLMVPKSVITDIKAALALEPVGTVEQDSSTWHPLISFNISMKLITSSE